MKQLTPNLMVDNVQETLRFYREVLGFSVVMTVPDEGAPVWAMVACGEVRLMFQDRASIVAEYPKLDRSTLGGALTFYIKVDDVTELYARVKDRATILRPLHRTFYDADEFALEDCNGFILTFAADSTAGQN